MAVTGAGVDDGDQFVIELGSGRIGVSGGVISLPAQDVNELYVGLVEPAAFADGLEPTVELNRPGAVSATGALPGGQSSLAAVTLRQLFGAVVRYVRGAMKRAAWADAANPVADPRLPGRRLDQP